MTRSMINTQEMEALPEAELMVDVVMVRSSGGKAAPVHNSTDLDQVLQGDAIADEVWAADADQHPVQPRRRRRWMPGALAAAGVTALVAGALVVGVGLPSAAAERPEVIPSTLERSQPAAVDPLEETATGEVATPAEVDFEAETPTRKRPRSRRGASKEELRKQVLEAMGVDSAAQPAAAPAAPVARRARNTNTPMFLASRIYRRNKRTLLACDRLAQRRGEGLANSRAMFSVSVDAAGAGSVKVTGRGIAQRRMSCYQVMARRWRLPATGAAYRTAFKHIN